VRAAPEQFLAEEIDRVIGLGGHELGLVLLAVGGAGDFEQVPIFLWLYQKFDIA
jgi:hypothetical protein